MGALLYFQLGNPSEIRCPAKMKSKTVLNGRLAYPTARMIKILFFRALKKKLAADPAAFTDILAGLPRDVNRPSEYTDQYITDAGNHSCARFTFLLNELSTKVHPRSPETRTPDPLRQC